MKSHAYFPNPASFLRFIQPPHSTFTANSPSSLTAHAHVPSHLWLFRTCCSICLGHNCPALSHSLLGLPLICSTFISPQLRDQFCKENFPDHSLGYVPLLCGPTASLLHLSQHFSLCPTGTTCTTWHMGVSIKTCWLDGWIGLLIPV